MSWRQGRTTVTHSQISHGLNKAKGIELHPNHFKATQGLIIDKKDGALIGNF